MRLLISFLLFSIITITLHATHNRAGEIVYKQTGDKTIEATIITYTKTSSIPADRDRLEICWGDNTCEALLRVNDNGEELSNDYKVNYYIGSHTYEKEGTYILSMTDPNRNSNILNIGNTNSDLVSFHIQSTFFLSAMSSAETNQSPQLLEPPIDIGFVRQKFMHTPNAIDLDGDSIAYELVTPMSALGETVPDYRMVDEIGPSAENTYSFNEQTGLFLWNSPQLVGEYSIAYKIKSYRNGQLQDELLRDMQILIMPEENIPPGLESDNFHPAILEVSVGTTIQLSFTAFDLEDGEADASPMISASGEIFNKGATFDLDRMFANIRGTLKWTIKEQDLRSLPYQVAIKAVDSKGASTFLVIQIKTTPLNVSTRSQEIHPSTIHIFPNPVKNFLNIDFERNFDGQVRLVDLAGQEIYQQVINSTSHKIETQALNNGIYFLQLNGKEGYRIEKILKF